MKTGIVVIYDEDANYTNQLMNYISDKKELPFQVVTFTEKEKTVNYVNHNSVEMILIGEEYMDAEMEINEAKRIILLSKGRVPSKYSQYKAIYKYKSAENIIKEIMENYIDITSSQESVISLKNKSKIIGIYSPIGRSGKTTFSIALGLVLSETSKTLFISFDENATFQNNLEISSPSNLSDLMYYFKQNRETLYMKLQAIVQRMNNLDYISPLNYSKDLKEIKVNEWIELINTISETGVYENIVLDLGNTLEEINLILDYCDQLYMPLTSDYISETKITLFEKNLLQCEKELTVDKITKIKTPLLEDDYIPINGIDTLGMSKVGDFVRGLIKNSCYE